MIKLLRIKYILIFLILNKNKIMEYILISATAFLVAILNFFSGFGLGTILTPAFMLFFPVKLAIALTAIVHLLNNLFKFFLVGKNASKEALIKFGIPSVIFAFVGSYTLVHLNKLEAFYSYSFFGSEKQIYPINLTIAVILFFFAILDLFPFLSKIKINKNKIWIGGILSGFFGGLSGNQGAFRSIFLLKAGLTKEAYIGTAVVCSIFIDLTRLSVYSNNFLISDIQSNIGLVGLAAISAMFGSYFGNKLLKKVTLKFIQVFVAIALIFLSVALGLGLI